MKKNLFKILLLISVITLVLLSTYTYNNAQETGEMYKQNINKLIFDLEEADSMYQEMQRTNQIDHTYSQVSATKFAMYLSNVSLGEFKEQHTHALTTLISMINSLTDSNDTDKIEEVLSHVELLTKEVKDIKDNVNSESNLRWYLMLN